ncbi:MAG: sulfurtransferase [Zetaproteobacteria bacterium CG1_02_53_45]|nr:MAG: sulfurtransferase [Zetaproteobacteria bacterium CG1_02_53_45]
MTTERVIRIIAGFFIMLSVFLTSVYNGGVLNEPTWLWFTLFVGANLFQSGFTRWCLMEKILIKLGVKPGGACGSC